MCNQSIPIDINLSIDCYWKSIPIDNHTNLRHRLVIDYQSQSINRHRFVLIDIDCHRLSISSIGYPGVMVIFPTYIDAMLITYAKKAMKFVTYWMSPLGLIRKRICWYLNPLGYKYSTECDVRNVSLELFQSFLCWLRSECVSKGEKSSLRLLQTSS